MKADIYTKWAIQFLFKTHESTDLVLNIYAESVTSANPFLSIQVLSEVLLSRVLVKPHPHSWWDLRSSYIKLSHCGPTLQISFANQTNASLLPDDCSRKILPSFSMEWKQLDNTLEAPACRIVCMSLGPTTPEDCNLF